MSCEKHRAREILHKFQRCLKRLSQERADLAAEFEDAGVRPADLDAAGLPEEVSTCPACSAAEEAAQPQPARGRLLRA